MDEDQKLLLQNFLGKYWSLWVDHCEETGDEPNDVYVNVLGGEPE